MSLTSGRPIRTLVESRTSGRYAIEWDGRDDAGRLVLGAALHQHVDSAPRRGDLELAVAEEERRARAALQQRVARLGEVAHGVEDMNFGVEFFTAGRIDDGAVQDAHSGSFT